MIGGVRKLRLIFGAIIVVLLLLCSVFAPNKVYAARQITLAPSTTNVRVDKTFSVQVNIDTDGEKINTVSFDIDFPTEIIDGQVPNQANSNFPMCAVLTPNKVSCGAAIAGGTAVNGLVTTLTFKAKHSGNASISISNFEIQQVHEESGKAVVENLSGFSNSSIDINIGDKNISNSTSNDGIAAPTTTSPSVEAAVPGLAAGSIPQVIGPTGSTPEDALKHQIEADQNGEVKGSFIKNPLNLSYITNIFMLLILGFLVYKLFFTEKRRQLEMERLFEDQLGTLSVLESKMDIFDQKTEGAKEKIIKEFEEAKNQIFGKAKGDKKGDKSDK